MGKLLPVILLLIGTGTGVGVGIMLRPAPVAEAEAPGTDEAGDETAAAKDGKTPATSKDAPKPASKTAAKEGEDGEHQYVKLNNQFVIPVVEEGAVSSLVMMSLSVEVDAGYREHIFSIEPKLRDSFLRVLFDHANIGGFRGAFTRAENLNVLRAALREVAMRDGGEHVSDVLILEVARQDY